LAKTNGIPSSLLPSIAEEREEKCKQKDDKKSWNF